jgi:cytochrome P450
VLRLYPPVPASAFVAIEDTMLPTGGGKDGKHPIFIRKGQYVSSCIYAMHRRKDIYGLDAEIFRPERWEDKSLRPGYASHFSLLPRYTQLVLIYHRWGYLPFNGGPRVCLGQQFALTELAYTTVRLLQEFETVESRDDSPWQELFMTSVAVKTGCQVSLIPYGGVVLGKTG